MITKLLTRKRKSVENDEFEKLQLLSLEDYHELEDTVEEKVKVNALEEDIRKVDPGYFLQSNEQTLNDEDELII